MNKRLNFWLLSICALFTICCALIGWKLYSNNWPIVIAFYAVFLWILYNLKRSIDLLLKKQHISSHQTSERLINEARDREVYEEAMLRNENKFRNFVSNSPDGIVLIDEVGIVNEWNQALSEITGIPREKALGAYCWDLSASLFPPSVTEHQLHPCNPKEQNNSSEIIREAEIITNDKQSRVLQIKNFTIPGSKGLRLASIIRDVTAIKEKDSSIREKAERLRTIFENTHQSFILLDTKSRIVDFNANANTMATDIFGAHLTPGAPILDFLSAKNRAEMAEWIYVVKCGENVQAEINIHTADEQDNWFEFHLTPVYNDDMQLIGIFINFFDIQLRKKSEEEIRIALKLEQELSRLKSQFVSSVSHEFRTPLASISSNVQLLHHSSAKWDEIRRENTFNRIYASIEHMTSLIENASLLGKGQSGMHKFEPVSSDVIKLCMQVIEETESNFVQKGRVKFTTQLTEMEALLDINLTKHILINLLNNALKYSDVKTIVNFELEHKNSNMLLFTIEDHGIGIDGESMKNIFEPFIRGNNVGSIAGTGLGMAIVKQCVDIHNGTIKVESSLGKGTKVRVKLPYQIAVNKKNGKAEK
jgi:PAS domain S-box-containing protein